MYKDFPNREVKGGNGGKSAIIILYYYFLLVFEDPVKGEGKFGPSPPSTNHISEHLPASIGAVSIKMPVQEVLSHFI